MDLETSSQRQTLRRCAWCEGVEFGRVEHGIVELRSLAKKAATRLRGRPGIATTYVARMLYGDRSEQGARAKSRHFLSPEIDWNEYIIATAKDIPGKNCIALILDDQPCLADSVINHPEEPVVLLAHPDKYALAKAAEGVVIETDSLSGDIFRWKRAREDPRLFGARTISLRVF